MAVEHSDGGAQGVEDSRSRHVTKSANGISDTLYEKLRFNVLASLSRSQSRHQPYVPSLRYALTGLNRP